MKYKVSSKVLDPEKLEKDFTFCGVFTLNDVDECVVKYILAGRGCKYENPTEVTFDGIKSYVTNDGGEVIYVRQL